MPKQSVVDRFQSNEMYIRSADTSGRYLGAKIPNLLPEKARELNEWLLTNDIYGVIATNN